MSILMGNKRISEDVYPITSANGINMTVTIEGITSYDDLKGKILWFYSPVEGGPNALLNINNLGNISICSSANETGVSESWCESYKPFALSLITGTASQKNIFILCN